ncbi:hypothetical protein NE237_018802 [Protea cynaroides]|uniref:Uncharacterized protein n=1 Tax=Protea cynaroides TaxID=273540 RepID=A0A9Q0KAI8_9MAGN|nr:hypothetical protein NE237_018802 [Protea cynaroides]
MAGASEEMSPMMEDHSLLMESGGFSSLVQFTILVALLRVENQRGKGNVVKFRLDPWCGNQDVQNLFLELSPGGTANVEERSIIKRGWFSSQSFPVDVPRLEWRDLMRNKNEIVIFNVLLD